ncbi:MAG: type I-E CRISPR-associated protein Cse1/CasA [Firmicutes bacterium]|nr:type I-E CRISPR-associated protein Cse1/CasA [Bacillota bacterium]
MPRFNLINEPWIPCLMLDGTPSDLGLHAVLRDAHEIREVFDPSPLVTVAVHRLLLTILHRNFGPQDLTDWQSLWRAGAWPASQLEAYYDQHQEGFDLFHPCRPFYQVPVMEDAKTHPVQCLAAESASRNNATLFDHSNNANPAPFLPGRAALYLLACQGYHTGGGKSSPFNLHDGPLSRGFTVLAQGNNLFETLALNLIAYNRFSPIPWQGEDLPVWEQESPDTPNQAGTHPRGYLDYLTWQSRRIHLVPEGNPSVVRFCQLQQNLKLANPFPPDPFKAYNRDEKYGEVPLKVRSGRALWRDAHTLFQLTGAQYRRPEVLNWLAQIELARRRAVIDVQAYYRFTISGFATTDKAAKIVLWRYECLPLPLVYLNEPMLLKALSEAVIVAEDVGAVLQKAVYYLAHLLLAPESDNPEARQPATGDIRQVADHLAAEHLFWPCLETPFHELLMNLPEGGETVESEWRGFLKQVAHSAFNQIINGIEPSARVLKATAAAERYFRRALGAAMKE